MPPKSRVIGINRTSDASCCIFQDGALLAFLRKERLSRTKHAWGSSGDISLYANAYPDLLQNVDIVVECFSSDDERARLALYHAELAASIRQPEPAIVSEISHHFAHAYSAFHPSGFTDAAILIADNRGSPRDLVSDVAAVATGQGVGPLEVITLLHGGAAGIRPVAKQWWSRELERPAGLGMFYSLASKAVLGAPNREGVLMGLAAYGNPSRFPLPSLEIDGIAVRIPSAWNELLFDQDRFARFRDWKSGIAEPADFAARVQLAFEEALLAIARHARSVTGASKLIYSGGCALNCSANARLIAESGFEQVFIPPACDDGGSAIGCALYGIERLSRGTSGWRWSNDYLGPDREIDEDALVPLAASLALYVEKPAHLAREMAASLARGEIVALCQGRSEAGPRALGNRSILANPAQAQIRDFVNREVKHREWFRPLAPVVPIESVARYFEIDGAAPFMQRRVMVRPEWQQALEAVCHIDGSARVQTVSREQNPFLHELLREFEKLAGIDVLLNTSFNGQDEPIVETLADACRAMARMRIHRLAVPPFYLGKRQYGS